MTGNATTNRTATASPRLGGRTLGALWAVSKGEGFHVHKGESSLGLTATFKQSGPRWLGGTDDREDEHDGREPDHEPGDEIFAEP